MLYYKLISLLCYTISLLGGGEGTISGIILLHLNCDSEVPAVCTGYTSTLI